MLSSNLKLFSRDLILKKWCRTFYGRYKQEDQLDIVITPNDTPNNIATGQLNLYYPERFYKPTHHLSTLTERQKSLADFNKKFDLDKLPVFVKVSGDIVQNGHYVDSPGGEWGAFYGLIYAWLCDIDDCYDQHIAFSDKQTKFAIGLYQNAYDCLNNLENPPAFPEQLALDEYLLSKAERLREVFIGIIAFAEHLMPGPQFRAWQRSWLLYFHYYVHYDCPIRILKNVQKRQLDMAELLIGRSVSVGILTLTAYYLDPNTNLDRLFINDSYVNRMGGFHTLLTNDLFSVPKDNDSEEKMAYVQVLKDSGVDPKVATLSATNKANEMMRILECHFDTFTDERPIAFAQMRAMYTVADVQLAIRRYGWTMVNNSDEYHKEI